MSRREAFSSDTNLGKSKKIEKEASAKFDHKNLPEAFLSVTLPSNTIGKTRKRDYDLFTFKGILSLDDPSHSKWGLTDSAAAIQQRNEEHWYNRIHGSSAKKPMLSGLTSAHGEDRKTLIEQLFDDGPDLDYLDGAYDGITIVSTKLKTPGAPQGSGTDLFKFNVVFSKERLNAINHVAAVKYATDTGSTPPGVLGQGATANSYDLFVYDQNQPGQSKEPNSDHQPMFSLEIRKGAFKDQGIRKFLKLMRNSVRGDDTSTDPNKSKYNEAYIFRQMLGRYYKNLVNSKVDGRMLEPMFCFIRRVAGESNKKNSDTLFDADTCLFGYWFGVRNFKITTEWPMDESEQIKVKDASGSVKSLRFKDVKASLNVFSAFLHLSRSVLINIRELDLNMSINHIAGLFTDGVVLSAIQPSPKMTWFIAGGVPAQVPANNDYVLFANSAIKAATLRRDIIAYCTTMMALLNGLVLDAQHQISPAHLIAFANASKILVSCITTRAQGQESAMDASDVINPLIIAQTTSDIKELLRKHKMLTKKFIAPVVLSVLNGVAPAMGYKDIVAYLEDTDRKISMLSANVGYQTAKIFKNLKVINKRLTIKFKPDTKDAKMWAYSKKSRKFGTMTTGTSFGDRSSKRGFEACSGIGGPNGITIAIGESSSKRKFIGRSTWIDAFRFFQFNGLDLAATDYDKEIGDSYGLFGAVMIAQASTRRAMTQGVSGQNTLAGLVTTCDKVETYLEKLLKQTHSMGGSIFTTYQTGEAIDINTNPSKLNIGERVSMAEWRKIYFLLHENYGFGITGNDPNVKCAGFVGGPGQAGNEGDPFNAGAYNVVAPAQGNPGCGWNQIPMGISDGNGAQIAGNNFRRPIDIGGAVVNYTAAGAVQVTKHANNPTHPILCVQGHSTMGIELSDFVAPYAKGAGAASIMHHGVPGMDGYDQAITQHEGSLFQTQAGALQFTTYVLASNNPTTQNLNTNLAQALPPTGIATLSALGTNHYESFILVSAAANSDTGTGTGANRGDRSMRGVYKQDIQETLNLVQVAKTRVAKLMKIKQSLIMQNSLHKATGQAAHKLALVSATQPGTQLRRGDPITWAKDMAAMGDQLANIINYYLLANQVVQVAQGANHPARAICEQWSNIFGLHGAGNNILKSDGTALTYGFGNPAPSIHNNTNNTAWAGLNPTAYAGQPAVLSAVYNQQLLAVFTVRYGPPAQPNIYYLRQGVNDIDISGISKNDINKAVIVGAVNTLINSIGAHVLQRETKCQLMSSVYSAYNPIAVAIAPLNTTFRKAGSGGGLVMGTAGVFPPLIPSNPAANPQNQKIANQNNSDHALLRVLIAQCRRLNDLPQNQAAAQAAMIPADYTAAVPDDVASYANIYGLAADAANAQGGPWNKLRNRLLNLHHTALKAMAESLYQNLQNMDLSADLLTMEQPAGQAGPATFAKFVNAQMKFRRDAPKFLKMCYNAGLTFQMLLPRFGFLLEQNTTTAAAMAPPFQVMQGPAAAHAPAIGAANQYRVNLPAAAGGVAQGMDISEVCLLFDVFMGAANPGANGDEPYKYECAPMLPNSTLPDVRVNCPLASYGNVGCVEDDINKRLTNPNYPGYKFSEIKEIFDHIRKRKQGLKPYTQWANIVPTQVLGTGPDRLCNNLQGCKLGNNYIVQNLLFDNMVSIGTASANLNGASFAPVGQQTPTGPAATAATVVADNEIVNFAQFGGIAGAGLKYESGGALANTKVFGQLVMARAARGPKGSLGTAELFSGFSLSNRYDNTGQSSPSGNGLLDDDPNGHPYSTHIYDQQWGGGIPRCFCHVQNNNYTNPYTLNATTLVRMRSLESLDTVRVLQIGGGPYPGITTQVAANMAIRNTAAGAATLAATFAAAAGADASKVGPPVQGVMLEQNSRPDAFLDLMYKEPPAAVPAVYVPSACEHYEKVMTETDKFADVSSFFKIGNTNLTRTVIQAGGNSSAQFGGSAKLCYSSYVNYFNQLYVANPKLAKRQMKKLFKMIK